MYMSLTVVGPWDSWKIHRGSSSGYDFFDKQAKWIWVHENAHRRSDVPSQYHTFSTSVNVSTQQDAVVHIVVDNRAVIYVNNQTVKKVSGGWWSGTNYPKVPIALKPGENVIDIETINVDPPTPGGLLASIVSETGNVLSRTGDGTWHFDGGGGGLVIAPPASDDIIESDPNISMDDAAFVTGSTEKSSTPTILGIPRTYFIIILVLLLVFMLASSSMSMLMMR